MNSQAQKKSFEELEKMSRGELIQMAVDGINNSPYLKNASFNITNFDRISVSFCNSGEIKSVWVSFDMSYRFVPLNSCYYYGFAVNLCDGLNSYGPVCNYKNPSGCPIGPQKFYNFTVEYNKVIQFIINSINNSSKVPHIPDGKLYKDDGMTIYEKEKYYQIEISSPSGSLYYKIKKNTGKAYDITSDTNAEPPFDKDAMKCYEKQ
jgi:hypothetical protein